MKYNWIYEYCSNKKYSVKDFKIEWNVTRFLLCDKMYIMIGQDKNKKNIITLKLLPENGLILREQYKDITPGYYMNKVHWNSIFLNGNVPDDVMKKMIDESYDLIYNSLTKKQQKELNNVGD